MKFLLHFSPQQFAPATDRFPMFVSEHATAKEALETAISKFGFTELDRCTIKVIGGEWPDQRLPIKLCAVCERPFAGFGRICPDVPHSKASILEAFGAKDEGEI